MKITLLALLLATPSMAQESASFLKLGVGAQAVGMGGAYTAVAENASAIAWNPAGLGLLDRRELGFTHAELLAGTRLEHLAYAQPLRFGTLGAGASYLSQPSLGGRDAQGRPTGGFAASDSALSLSYGAALSRAMRLGAGVKFIQTSLAEKNARTGALDFGGLYSLGSIGPGVPQLGFAVQNLGPGMRLGEETSPLPLTLAAGVGYRLPVGMLLSLDVRHRPYGSGTEVGFGTEYAILPSFALRAGYATNKAEGPRGSGMLSSLAGLAAGFGLRMRGYSLDYSMTPFGELGNMQRISIGSRFGPPARVNPEQ